MVMPDTYLRRASALVITFDGGELLVTNYLTSRSFTCDSGGLDLLARSSDWRPIGSYYRDLEGYSRDSIRSSLEKLIEGGGLIARGSEEAKEDEAYATKWEWGHTAGLFHFGSKNPNFMTREEAEAYLVERAGLRPSPTTYQKNTSDEAVALPEVTTADPVLSAMLARRSVRAFLPTPVSREQLGEALFSGLGILGLFEHPDLGTMPVTLTPSGGARNPFEAYVYCRNVEQTPTGLHHYSALQHSLEVCGPGPWPEPIELLPEQVWVDDAAAIVFLVANFDRTMWKYGEAFAYKTILIEAGHIAQNIAVTCAKMGLAANPTLGIHDEKVERALGLEQPLASAIYALSIGYPDASIAPFEVEGDKASF